MTYSIVTIGDLPVGYQEADFFRDRGRFLSHAYESEAAARLEFNRQYRGADCDGVEIKWQIVEGD